MGCGEGVLKDRRKEKEVIQTEKVRGPGNVYAKGDGPCEKVEKGSTRGRIGSPELLLQWRRFPDGDWWVNFPEDGVRGIVGEIKETSGVGHGYYWSRRLHKRPNNCRTVGHPSAGVNETCKDLGFPAVPDRGFSRRILMSK